MARARTDNRAHRFELRAVYGWIEEYGIQRLLINPYRAGNARGFDVDARRHEGPWEACRDEATYEIDCFADFDARPPEG